MIVPDSGAALKRAFVDLATAFRSSAVLLTALELDVFSHIPAEGAWPEAVARAVAVDTHRVRLLLNAMAAMGLLSQQGGRFFLPPEYTPLVRRGPSSFASYLLSHRREAENLLDLAATLRGDDMGPRFGDELRHSELAGPYLAYLEEVSTVWAGRLVDRLSPFIADLRRIQALGGACGAWLRQLLDLNGSLTATVLDFEPAVTYCRARHLDTPYAERMTFVAGDPRAQDFRDEFDLVIMDNVLHYCSRGDKREIVQRAVMALRAGGRVALVKLRLDANGIEPPGTSIFSLRIAAVTGHGYQETDAEAVALFGHAGASDIDVVPLTEHHTLIVGTREPVPNRQPSPP